MPAGTIGSCWEAGSWAGTAWEADSWADGGAAAVAIPGGTFRRALATWGRTFHRAPASWPRTVRRGLRTWARTWRYVVNPALAGTLTKTVSDDRVYCFGLSDCPELLGGDTIASGAITPVGLGLTFGTPAVLDAPFDDIASPFGMTVTISGGDAGVTYRFALVATLASGRKVTVPARVSVVADYDG